MIKKYYILALTFLCLLCGQMGYANDPYGKGEPGEQDVSECSWTDLIHMQSRDCFDDYLQYTEYYYCDSGIHIGSEEYRYLVYKECGVETFDTGDCTDPDSSAFPCDEQDDQVCSEYGVDAYLTACGCIGGNTGINECPETPPEPDSPPEPTVPPCNISSCPIGYNLQDCECKKDCEEEKYEEAIRNGKIIFTKKYGWVDMTHAFQDTSRESPIGVNNLWNQLKNPPSQSQIYMGYYSVNYKQDVVVAGISIGIERQFLVSPGLTLEERKSVALAILQNVSTAFELLQSVHPTSTSSFEPADLPSNMLNFYSHVEGLTKEQILNAIEPVSIVQAIEVLRSYPCTFTNDEYKNRSFEPVRFDSPYTSQNFGVPDILNTIVPFKVSPATDFGNADLILLEQDIISN